MFCNKHNVHFSVGENSMHKFQRILYPVILCLVILSSRGFASEYIPWQINDYAIYKSNNNQVTLEIDQTSSVWRHLTQFSNFGPVWLYSGQHSETVKLYAPNTINFQTFVDFSLSIGSQIPIDILPCNTGILRITGKNESLQVEAGLFDNVIKLNLETNCSDAGITQMWFAKNIGLIQWTELNIAGEITYQLSKAFIAGRFYPTSQGINITGYFPDQNVVIRHMPSSPEQFPKIRVGLQIENNQSTSMSYHFGTSQHFDIVIRDENNQVVSRWSRDKIFLQYSNTELVAPGSQFNVQDEIMISDENGELLAEGNYIVEIFLTATNGHAKVSHSITIRHELNRTN